MEKILSVCIPSYNMEKYLSRNLDSFIASGCLEELELIVVNDGSTDRTLEIANKFQSRFPDTVIIIDKPNGHYGSCVNVSLKIASGKYFRIVDADDWVDADALGKVLQILPRISTDVVYTKFNNYYEKEGKAYLNEDPSDMIWNEASSLDTIRFDKYVHMHQITYRTDFLRSIDYIQTEGVCYTDTEYVFKPLVCAKDIFCIDVSLYQYFIGRNDQSMSPNVLMKNFMHLYKVLLSILNYPRSSFTNANYDFLFEYFVNVLYGMLVDCLFASRCRNKEWNSILRSVTEQLQSRKIDLSHYWGYSIRGCHWFQWWLEGTLFSRLKLRTLFCLIDIKR